MVRIFDKINIVAFFFHTERKGKSRAREERREEKRRERKRVSK